MTEKKNKARFFCECCNHEVDNDAMLCPYCGRFFSSVKCPQCSYSGSHNEFIDGCPNCGYAMNNTQKKTKIVHKKQKHDDSLPFWIYIIAIFLLLALLFIILNYL